MDKDDLKIYLKENTYILEQLLENIGLQHIRLIRNEYISCGFAGSRRRDSVNVKLNDSLDVVVWSKNDNVKDIYGLIQLQMKCGFFEALEIACDMCGVKLGKSRTKSIERFMRRSKVEKKEYKRPNSVPLNYDTSDCFIRDTVRLFSEDGIGSYTQEVFDVGFDALDNRVVFPIRDYEGNILTFKGRTLNSDYIEKGIPKYLYYHNFNGRHYLYGFYENYWNILDDEYIIVLESEKAVMQLYDMGYKNAVATSKKRVSEEQVFEINNLGKKVVLAYDKDVSLGEILGECSKFSGEVYYIYDKEGLLKGKESPTDVGKEIWGILYKNKIKYEVVTK